MEDDDMANGNGTDPSVAPVGRRETSVRTSLHELQRIEEERLRLEEEAERATEALADREREETERRGREEAAERARQTEAEATERRRVEAAATERARLLDVDRRVADRERELRAEFALERARLIGERDRPTSGTPRALIAVITVIALVSVTLAVVTELRVRRVDQANVRVLANAERLSRDIRAIETTGATIAQRTAVLDRELTETRERAARAEARVLELERAPAARTRPARAATTPPRPTKPPQISPDVSDDPLGDLAGPARKR